MEFPVKMNSNQGILRFTFLILTISLLAGSFTSCKKEEVCHDIDYGKQDLIEEPVSLFPYKKGDDLVFKDSLGEEIKLSMIPGGVELDYLDYAQPVEEGDCAGRYEVLSKLQFVLTNFRNDSLDYLVICHYGVNSIIADQLPRYFDVFGMTISTTHNNPQNWGVGFYRTTNSRGNDIYLHDTLPNYIFEETKNFGPKIFQNVYSTSKSDGSYLAYNHSTGLLAFQQPNGALWVLDRIE